MFSRKSIIIVTANTVDGPVKIGGVFVIKRVIWIILDSVGMGSLPDAGRFGDEGCHTLSHVWQYNGGLKIPNLIRLGLGNIDGQEGLDVSDAPIAGYGRVAERSNGKDTTIGHWEMTGIITEEAFPVYPKGFPDYIIDEFIKQTGVAGVLGNYPASGTKIIEELGQEHMKTACPIVYTSADSVFQIAAHEEVIPLERLYEMCRIARNILTGKDNCARVIARPFTGEPGAFVRTANRRDFSRKPGKDNLLCYLQEAGLPVTGVGKIEDIFAGVGITEAIHTRDNHHGMEVTAGLMEKQADGLIFTNLVEFDSKWGHRNDPAGYGKGLEEFDCQLAKLLDGMTKEDLLIINADHGCDPTTPGTDHTREYIPLIMYYRGMKSVNLKTGKTFADIGQTIAEVLGCKRLPAGESYARQLGIQQRKCK